LEVTDKKGVIEDLSFCKVQLWIVEYGRCGVLYCNFESLNYEDIYLSDY